MFPVPPPVRLVLALAIGMSSAADAADAAEVYFNDFQTSVGSGWSSTSPVPWGIEATPLPADDSRRFLGYFGGDTTLSLTLTDLPVTTGTVSVEFDLYLMWSWDGEDTRPVDGVARGPDVFGFSVDGGAGPGPVRSWTFSHGNGALSQQSYCEGFAAPCAPTTGAEERYTLGYRFDILPTEEDLGSTTAAPMDSVYRLTGQAALSGSAVTLTFSSQGLQVRDDLTFPYLDEAWGIDNLRVSVAVPEPAPAALVLSGLLVLGLAGRRLRRR